MKISTNLKSELYSLANRDASLTKYRGDSIKGRAYCAWHLPCHAIGIVTKPIFYLAATLVTPLYGIGKGLYYLSGLAGEKRKNDAGTECLKAGKRTATYALCIIVAPTCQALKAARAACGILHPGAYYRPSVRVSLRRIGFQLIISCDLDAPTKYPLQLLRKIAKAAKNAPSTKLAVQYHGQNGIDNGGLGRDFMHRLFRSLSEQYKLDASVIHWTPNRNKDLMDIGKILRMAIKGDQPIGDCFHPDYFAHMLHFESSEVATDFERLSHERLLDLLILTAPEANKEIFEKTKRLIAWNKKNQDEKGAHEETLESLRDILFFDLPPLTNNNLEVIKKSILAQIAASETLCLRTVHTIAKGMALKQDAWNDLKKGGAKNLQETIQGKFDRGAFIAAIRFEGFSDIQEKKITKVLKKKTDKELKNFLKFATGSPCIPLHGPTLKLDPYVKNVEAHTCSSQINIPLWTDEKWSISIEDELLVGLVEGCCVEEKSDFSLA